MNVRREREGSRVQLIKCTDTWTKIPPGTEGTVEFVDDTGTVFVKWDTGARLGLIPGHDLWTVLP